MGYIFGLWLAGVVGMGGEGFVHLNLIHQPKPTTGMIHTQLRKEERAALVEALTAYPLNVTGHEGYKKAEVGWLGWLKAWVGRVGVKGGPPAACLNTKPHPFHSHTVNFTIARSPAAACPSTRLTAAPGRAG